jgi:dTDP-4-dehydrorhamnose 3,5-epimerase
MQFRETKIRGAYLIELDKKADERGFFARSWCQEEFESRGLSSRIVQCNIGFSPKMGTVRGIHYQQAPHADAKVVRCCRGAIYDVIVDVRPESATYGEWNAVELTAESHTMMYIPEGLGHGYQTLRDDTEILYQTSEFYHPESAVGIRYNDPAFEIDWPLPVACISQGDTSLPDVTGDRVIASTQPEAKR